MNAIILFFSKRTMMIVVSWTERARKMGQSQRQDLLRHHITSIDVAVAQHTVANPMVYLLVWLS